MGRRAFLRCATGATLGVALRSFAQTRAPLLVGYLDSTNPSAAARFTQAFREGLESGGFVEGRDVLVEYRWAEGRFDRLPELARELIARRPALIVSATLPAVLAAKNAIHGKIPMVFAVSADPVEFGVVSSMNAPEGNVTGVSQVLGPLGAKRVEIMHELLPAARTIGILSNPTNPHGVHHTHSAVDAANRVRLKTVVLEASAPADLEHAVSKVSGIDGLLIGDDPIFRLAKEQLVAAVTRHNILTMHFGREFVEAGGLISYGPYFPALYQQLGRYTARVLKGAKTSELPVVQPDRFELVINAGTAKALKLSIPEALVLRATEVVT